MSIRTSFDDAGVAYALPRLIRLGQNLYGACFTLMKMVPARFILRRAQRAGRLEPGVVIAETTSGGFGLALAIQAVHLNRRLLLITDPGIDRRLYRRLTDLGAAVERVPDSAGATAGGHRAAHLARLDQIKAQHPGTLFCPEQYANPDNPRSYATVAELFLECLGQVDCLVGPVGSGGSMCGTASYLRSLLPECRAIAVDTPDSVRFGPRAPRGPDTSLMPANLDHTVFDAVHWCTASAAFAATRQLHQQHALFMGHSSGAAYLVARWWAQANPDALTVVMMPDEGHLYQDTVYNDEWLEAEGHLAQPLPVEPVPVDDPSRRAGPWTVYDWARRPYPDVLAAGRTVRAW